jgi:hypothetical protein
MGRVSAESRKGSGFMGMALVEHLKVRSEHGEAM